MNESLKQRLVGALILVALGVVFWPIIFVPPADRPAVSDVDVPPRPTLQSTPIPAPSGDDLRGSQRIASDEELQRLLSETQLAQMDAAADVAPNEQASAPQEAEEPAPKPAPPQAAVSPEPEPVAARVRVEAPVSPTLDEQGIPVAWALQVVTVSSPERAENLRKQLLSMGHEAFTKRLAGNGRTLVRVYVGPKFEKAQLEAAKADIDAALKVNSIIGRYLP